MTKKIRKFAQAPYGPQSSFLIPHPNMPLQFEANTYIQQSRDNVTLQGIDDCHAVISGDEDNLLDKDTST